MINWITGTEMSVPVDLVERYKAAGHRLAEPIPAPAEEPTEEPAKPKGRKN